MRQWELLKINFPNPLDYPLATCPRRTVSGRWNLARHGRMKTSRTERRGVCQKNVRYFPILDESLMANRLTMAIVQARLFLYELGLTAQRIYQDLGSTNQ